MNDLWQFSAKSEPKLQKLFEEISKNPKPDVEWNKLLRRPIANTPKVKIDLVSQECGKTDITSVTYNKTEEFVIESDYQKIIEEEELSKFKDLVDNDLETNVKLIIYICMKNKYFWTHLSTILLERDTEQFVKYILNENINTDYWYAFYTNFFINLLTERYSRTILQLTTDLYHKNTSNFVNYLLPLMYSEEFSNEILLDFCKIISDSDSTRILKEIARMKSNFDIFSKHLPSILCLYKNSEKSDIIQNYVFNNLTLHAEGCSNDKNYGKLLLVYIQNQDAQPRNYSDVEKLITEHNSVFKRPCLTALKNLQQLNSSL